MQPNQPQLNPKDVELAQWCRHYDSLLWTVTTLFSAMYGGLVVFSYQYFSLKMAVVGFVILPIPVYFAASFRETRNLLVAQMTPEFRKTLYKPRTINQWILYLFIFFALLLLWLNLLIIKVPEYSWLWITMFFLLLSTMVYARFVGNMHSIKDYIEQSLVGDIEKTDRPSTLAEINFENVKETLKTKSPEEIFKYIFDNNIWGSNESKSGVGSESEATIHLSRELKTMIKKLKITSLLDIPCGDFNWIKKSIENINYIGADIVKALIEGNIEKNNHEKLTFQNLDIIESPLPQVDMIFSRDCLLHFSNHLILKAILNCIESNSKYLAMTTFTSNWKNEEIQTGNWRPINFTKTPFNLPVPSEIILELCNECDGAYTDKSIGVWEIKELKKWRDSFVIAQVY